MKTCKNLADSFLDTVWQQKGMMRSGWYSMGILQTSLQEQMSDKKTKEKSTYIVSICERKPLKGHNADIIDSVLTLGHVDMLLALHTLTVPMNAACCLFSRRGCFVVACVHVSMLITVYNLSHRERKVEKTLLLLCFDVQGIYSNFGSNHFSRFSCSDRLWCFWSICWQTKD